MARDAYKNLKIQFEGDDTGLSEALREIQRQSRAAETELKSVDRALQLDPSNVELLSQKQLYAAKEAEQLKRRLDAVNAALSGGEVEKGSLAYDRLQRELVTTSDRLSKAEAAAKEASDALRRVDAGGLPQVSTQAGKASEALKELASRADKTADRLDKVGGALSKGVTAPVAAAAAGITAFGVDADNSMATLEAAVGSNVDAAQRLRDAGKSLWEAGWSDSLEELTPALVDCYEVLGDISEQDMTAAVRGAKTMERVWGSDVSESLRGVNVLVDKFGLSVGDATDLMVAGSQRGLEYTNELGDNLSEYAGRWAEAGTSASMYFSMLQAGVDAGAYSLDKVGDYLNEFLTSLSDGRMEESIGNFSESTQELWQSYKDGGATAQDVLNAVIGELDGCVDGTQRAQIASDVWSSLGEDNAWGVISALAGVSDSYGDVAGSAEGAASSIEDSIGNRAKSAVNDLKDSFEPFAERAVDLLERVADVAGDVSAWFSSLDEGTQQLVVDGALVAAAAGPVLSVGGRLVKGAGSLAKGLAGTSTAAKAASASASEATAAAGGLASGLAKTAGKALGVATIAPILDEVGSSALGASEQYEQAYAGFDSAIQAAQGYAGDVQALSDANLDMWRQFNATTEESQTENLGLWGKFQVFVAEHSSIAGGMATKAFAEEISKLDLATTSAWLAAQSATVAGGAQLDETTRGTVETIISSFEGLPDVYQEQATASMQALAGGMAAYIPELADTSGMTADEIISVIRERLLGAGGTQQVGGEAGSGLAQGISGQSGEVAGAAAGVAQGAVGATSGLPGQLSGTGAEAGGAMASSIAAQQGSVYGAAWSLRDATSSALSGVPSQMSAAGAFGGSGMAQGVASATWQVSSAAQGLAEATSAAANSNGAASWWGAELGQNFANGIWSALGAVRSAASAAASAVASFLHFSEPDEGPLSDFNESGYELGRNFADGIEGSTGAVRSAAMGMATAAALASPKALAAPSVAVKSGGLTAAGGWANAAASPAGEDPALSVMREIRDEIRACREAGVSVSIDGKAVARATAPAMDVELRRRAERGL